MYLAKRLFPHNNKILYHCRQSKCRDQFEKTDSQDGAVQVIFLSTQNRKMQEHLPVGVLYKSVLSKFCEFLRNS